MSTEQDTSVRGDDANVVVVAEYPDAVVAPPNPDDVYYIRSTPTIEQIFNPLTGEPEMTKVIDPETGLQKLNEDGNPWWDLVFRTAYESVSITKDEYIAAEQAAGIQPHPLNERATATTGFVDAEGVLYRVLGDVPQTHSAILPPGEDFCDSCGRTHVFTEIEPDTFKRSVIELFVFGSGRYCRECHWRLSYLAAHPEENQAPPVPDDYAPEA